MVKKKKINNESANSFNEYSSVLLLCAVFYLCACYRLTMTLPLVLPFGGWTKERDGMCLTETSCKILYTEIRLEMEGTAKLTIILELLDFFPKSNYILF